MPTNGFLSRSMTFQRRPRVGDSRLPLYTIIFSCIASLLINWFGVLEAANRMDQKVTEESYRDLQQTATLFADQVSNALNSVDTTLRLTAHYLSGPSMSLSELVANRSISLEHLVLLSFADKDGLTVETNLGADPYRTNLSDREHIRVHLENNIDGLFIGKPVIGRVSKLWSIQLTRRVNNPDGSLRGILVASVDPFYFSRFWEELLRSEESGMLQASVTLYGLDGVVRTGSRNMATGLENQTPNEAIRSVADRVSAGRLNELGPDTAQASYFIRMPSMPLIAVASYAKSGIAAKADSQKDELYLLGRVISAIIVITGAILLWSINVSRANELRAVAAETRLASALDTIKDSFAIYDSRGRLAAFNKSFSERFSRRGAMQDLQRIEEFLRQPAPRTGTNDTARENEIEIEPQHWLRVQRTQTPIGETVIYGADITQSRLREEALVERTRQVEAQAQRMEELATIAERAAKVKSSFLAAMSHEIRTPLNAINGFSQLLRKNSLEDEPRRISALISDSCRHLLEIVDDILDFTRLEADKVTLRPLQLSIQRLVVELMETAHVLAKDKPIITGFVINADVPPFVMADQRRLKQVLLNLISNAAKFTQAGRIDLKVSLFDQRLRFEVCDTGDGIPSAVGSRIFEPFEQASSEGRLRAAGTGLGLAISRRLVKLMQGEISFESHLGRGTIFRVEIPCVACESQEPVRKVGPDAASVTSPLRILIADDAASSRMLLRMMLSRQGHSVAEVDNGQKALELLQADPFDVVILDVQMPIMDGLRAAQTVRTLPSPLCELPLIALTAQVLDEEVERARLSGFDIVLGKPFMEEDLKTAIADAITHRL